MSWRDADDYNSTVSNYTNNYYNEYSAIKDELNEIKKQKNQLENTLAAIKKEKDTQLANKKAEKQLRLAEELSKIEHIRKLLLQRSYREVFKFAIKNNALTNLADEIEKILSSVEKSTNTDELENLLYEVIKQLTAENTKAFERRCMNAITALETAISEEKNNLNDESTIKKLEQERVYLYIKLYQGRHGAADGAINLPTITTILMNPSNTCATESSRDIRSFEEAVSELAIQRHAANMEVKKLKLNPILKTQLDQIGDLDQKALYMAQKIAELSNANQMLCAHNKRVLQKNNYLNSDLNSLQEKLTKVETQLVTSQQTVKELQQKNADLTTQHQELAQRYHDMEVAHQKLQQDYENKLSQYNAQKTEVVRLEQKYTQLKNSLDTLEKKLQQNYQTTIQEIKNDISSFNWKTHGRDVVANKPITASARKILDVIASYESQKSDHTEKAEEECLQKIHEIADKGKSTNMLYRFFFRQDASSRQRYQKYADLISGHITTLKN